MSTQEAADHLKIHQTPEWKAWLAETLASGGGTGGDLVERLSGPDSGPEAANLLKAAEALGWIERVTWAPSPSLAAFRALTYDFSSPSSRAFLAECWAWKVTAGHHETVRVYAGEAPPTRFAIGDRVKYTSVALVSLGASYRKSRGTVVGFREMGIPIQPYPLVIWDEDPPNCRACFDPATKEAETCPTPAWCGHRCKVCPMIKRPGNLVGPGFIRHA